MPPQPLTRATCRATGAGEGWTLIGQLIYDANHHTNGSAVLVMGDHGTTGEGKPHPKGQPPMGKCAEACINKVKVPVLLVRGNAKARLEQHPSLYPSLYPLLLPLPQPRPNRILALNLP